MSDQDHDGRLSRAEFIAAMSLCDAASKGIPIPSTLPAELSTGAAGRPATAPGMMRTSFEDERRANMEKGMAELERRRDAIRQRYLAL